MQPFTVINVGDEVIDACAGIGDAGERASIQLFIFECLHEAFGLGIVEGIARSRHGNGDVVVSEALTVVIGRILDAASEWWIRLPFGGRLTSRA